MYSDVLTTDDEEDEDDLEAHEASIQRLKVGLLYYSIPFPLTDCTPRKQTTPLET